MDKKVVLGLFIAAGAIGWLSRVVYFELKIRKNRKLWHKLNEDCDAILKLVKEKWPEAFDEGRKKFLNERGDELDEDFRKQIEQM